MPITVAAVDLGATSGRVVAVRFDGKALELEVVHRFPNGPVIRDDGSLRWEFDRLVTEMKTGLDSLIERGGLASMGVDAWGVDYGLIDSKGQLVAAPYSYRDRRTDPWVRVLDELGREDVYEITGIQMMPINTLIQLRVHDRRELDLATELLLIPELVVHSLTGEIVGEHTSASTSQLYDATKRDWSKDLIAKIGVDPGLFPKIERAGTKVGDYKGVPVHLVGGHDTASAIAALPVQGNGFPAYLSSGTWSLVGVELEQPLLTDPAMKANFTNEAGVFGNVRFLRNVMGMWMLDECCRQWHISIEEAAHLATEVIEGLPSIDATDERFLSPADMEAEIRAAAQMLPEGNPAVVRCILESLATAYASVIDQIEGVLGKRPDHLHVIGGGSRMTLLNDLTEQSTGLPVTPGPVEATSLGNALVQLIALGEIRDLEEGRRLISPTL